MNKETILNWLSKLNFKIQSGKKDFFVKDFAGYEISVDLEASKINYGKQIKVHRLTTSNLLQAENIVVLECVCRLLEKGYKPEDIELEKSWNLGHKGKGFLDILVKNQTSDSLFMIECKVWGEEFNKEKSKMFRDGGQLLSYFRQDRKPKALCLYSATIKNEKIHYTSEIIDTKNLNGDNESEIFESWDNTFSKNGIFGDEVDCYEYKNIGLTYQNLKDLETSDGKAVFHQFAEILRKHQISNKSNAFEIIFNLFICKIKDEDLNFDTKDQLKFQSKTNETNEELFDKLNELYKKSLEEYIGLIFPDISEKEFNELIESVSKNKEELRKQYRNLRYYRSSQEFSFKKVYDEETFNENAQVVKEVVKLLENLQIKYSKKHRHLGDFFELLLNTGFKQESGQFFTPIPLARFICKSLPIEKIINKKLQTEPDFLPYVIDYASGSGHFITEIMDEIDLYVKDIKDSDIKGKRAREEFRRDNLKWAKQYIYAVEIDRRLVQVSKVSSFLNGDGDANVISADGLAAFSDEKYKKAVKLSKENGRRENNEFDIIVSNPPYSVSGFKKNLKQGGNCFDLFGLLTDQSSEIECLFIERSKQLLKENGVAGIILPISILTNGGIYEKTREILFRNFAFKAIVSLGNQAFMATGTKTIIAFLVKRNAKEFDEIKFYVERFFEGGFVDVAVNGLKDAFSLYVKNVFEDLTFENYCKILKGENVDCELAKEYKALKIEEIKELEKQKLLYFILTYPQKIVLAESGEKDIEKEFYGFEFSNRRGHEGIHIYKDEEGNLQSKLYNEDQLELKDPNKLNSYILRNFEGEEKLENEISEIQNSQNHPLKNHIHYLRLSSLMTFDLKRFDKSVNLNKKNNLKIETKWSLSRLGEVCDIKKGKSITKSETSEGNIPVVAGGINPAYYHNQSNTKAPVITVSASGANAGYVNFWKQDIFASDCSTIKAKTSEITKTEFIFTILQNYQNEIYRLQKGKSQPHVYPEDLSNIKIPLPPLEVQNKIVEEITKIEQKENLALQTTSTKENQIRNLFSNLKNTQKLRIADIAIAIKGGGTPSTEKNEYWTPEINWATLIDVKQKYLYSTKRKISKEGLASSSAVLLPINTIIFSSRATIGEVSIAKVETATNQGFKNIICNPQIVDHEFLYYVLKFEGEKLKDNYQRTTYAEINFSQFLELQFQIPPLAEQQKIIAQIEPLEQEIVKAKEFLASVKEEKQKILDKYLK